MTVSKLLRWAPSFCCAFVVSGLASARPINAVIVIDNSLSMDAQAHDPNGMRFAAARLFVERGKKNDYLTVADFSNRVELLAPFQKLSKKAKKQLLADIDLIRSGRTLTDLNLALLRGAELLRKGKKKRRRALILFSDGHIDVVDGDPAKKQAAARTSEAQLRNIAIPLLREAGIEVFAVGVGKGANLELLTDLAEGTTPKRGAGTQRVFSVTDQGGIIGAFSEIEGELRGRRVTRKRLLLGDGPSKHKETVTPTSRRLEMDVTRPSGTEKIALRSPSGETVAPTKSRAEYESFTVSNPKAGDWEVEVSGPAGGTVDVVSKLRDKVDVSVLCPSSVAMGIPIHVAVETLRSGKLMEKRRFVTRVGKKKKRLHLMGAEVSLDGQKAEMVWKSGRFVATLPGIDAAGVHSVEVEVKLAIGKEVYGVRAQRQVMVGLLEEAAVLQLARVESPLGLGQRVVLAATVLEGGARFRRGALQLAISNGGETELIALRRSSTARFEAEYQFERAGDYHIALAVEGDFRALDAQQEVEVLAEGAEATWARRLKSVLPGMAAIIGLVGISSLVTVLWLLLGRRVRHWLRRRKEGSGTPEIDEESWASLSRDMEPDAPAEADGAAVVAEAAVADSDAEDPGGTDGAEEGESAVDAIDAADSSGAEAPDAAAEEGGAERSSAPAGEMWKVGALRPEDGEDAGAVEGSAEAEEGSEDGTSEADDGDAADAGGGDADEMDDASWPEDEVEDAEATEAEDAFAAGDEDEPAAGDEDERAAGDEDALAAGDEDALAAMDEDDASAAAGLDTFADAGLEVVGPNADAETFDEEAQGDAGFEEGVAADDALSDVDIDPDAMVGDPEPVEGADSDVGETRAEPDGLAADAAEDASAGAGARSAQASADDAPEGDDWMSAPWSGDLSLGADADADEASEPALDDGRTAAELERAVQAAASPPAEAIGAGEPAESPGGPTDEVAAGPAVDGAPAAGAIATPAPAKTEVGSAVDKAAAGSAAPGASGQTSGGDEAAEDSLLAGFDPASVSTAAEGDDGAAKDANEVRDRLLRLAARECADIVQMMTGLGLQQEAASENQPSIQYAVQLAVANGEDHFAGTMLMAADQLGGAQLAERVFGDSMDALDPADIKDTILELSNMLAGKVGKSDEALAVGSPELVELAPEVWAGGKGSIQRMRVGSEGGRMYIGWIN